MDIKSWKFSGGRDGNRMNRLSTLFITRLDFRCIWIFKPVVLLSYIPHSFHLLVWFPITDDFTSILFAGLFFSCHNTLLCSLCVFFTSQVIISWLSLLSIFILPPMMYSFAHCVSGPLLRNNERCFASPHSYCHIDMPLHCKDQRGWIHMATGISFLHLCIWAQLGTILYSCSESHQLVGKNEQKASTFVQKYYKQLEARENLYYIHHLEIWKEVEANVS